MRKKWWNCAVPSVVAAALLLTGCGVTGSISEKSVETVGAYAQEEVVYEMGELTGEATDYTDDDNWMILEKEPKEAVDLFYIYPTVYDEDGGEDFAKIDDPVVRKLAQLVYSKTGSSIGAFTNVYAPYYRQTNLAKAGEMSAEEYEKFNTGIPRTDIYAALDEYFENYNDGRPFIFAGHSQGSCMIEIILGDYMQAHPEYLDRMIAAYAIGFCVTTDWLAEHPYQKFAEGAGDTGVIISWNAEGAGNKAAGETLIVKKNAVSINPITWTRTDEKAEASENLGSRSIDLKAAYAGVADGSIKGIEDMEALWETTTPGTADAQIDLERGTVICTTSDDFNDNVDIFGPESFHSHDYDFYYYNIRENAKDRIAAYFKAEGEGTEAESKTVTASDTDYADKNNWIQLPEITKDVDTFYIYPTAYMTTDPESPMYCGSSDPGMRAIATKNFNTNKCVYEEATNVFAPFYSQTSVYALQDMGGEEAAEVLSGEPKSDLYAALDYYFENLNDGRPFILAGHSQGSMMIRIILKDYMETHPEYYERMVAAYAIGYSITKEDLKEHPYLKFAEGADDTGVIVSYNTEGEGNGDSRLVLEGAISINPINWKRDNTYAPASENLGTRITDAAGTAAIAAPGVADARVDTKRGVVICSNTDYPYIDTVNGLGLEKQVFGEKSFHGNDYSFYYENLKENVGVRVNSYLAKTGEKTDYSDKNNWLKLPEVTKEADTIYFYPTAYNDNSEGAPDVCDITEESMRAAAAAIYDTQATAYEAATNVYVPFYRQVNMAFVSQSSDEEREELMQGMPLSDIYGALDYYFENLNEGRPFILAAHSQGSQMMTYVLSGYMKDHPEYYDRMIAAYAIGYSITEDFLKENPHLSFAEGETDTGVIISWNTEGAKNKNYNNFVVVDGAIAINPLNWKRDETYAGADENLGSRILNDAGEYETVMFAADARLDTVRGVVVTNTNLEAPIAMTEEFGPQSYHGGDYTLFFNNIADNAAKRVEAYLEEME